VKLRNFLSQSRIAKISVAVLSLTLLSVPSPTIAAGVCSPAASTNVDIYTVLTFTSTTTCDWTVPSGVTSIDVFMVGAGGGGGGDGGGGGGGGASISRTAFAVTPTTALALTVGAGGNPSVWSTGYAGTNGSASTLVRNSPSTTLTANGGTKGILGPTGSFGAGGTAVNGGFAGGRGGNPSGAGNTKGGDGYTGVSNYFLGSLIEYGGGGGGGSYYSGSSVFTETLGKSGGGNGGNSASGNNQPGKPGRANSGGGGGGGSANSPQQAGGQGADGVILIRYVTDSGNAFPASLTSSLSGRFTPNDLQILDNSRKGWIDSSGTQATSTNITTSSASSMSVTTRGTTDGAYSTESSKTLLVAKGGTGDKATLIDLPTNYTLFHVTRYVSGGTNRRIMSTSSTSSNWISGHYNGTFKCAHHQAWLTGSGCSSTNVYKWLLSTDQLRYYRADGVDATLNPDDGSYLASQTIYSGFGVNNDYNGQTSNWEMADLLVFNKRLSAQEIYQVELYLSRIYGLSITTPPANSETDTAVSMSGSPYYYGYYRNDFTFDDLFTLEAWVKPTSTCSTGTCAFFSTEATLVTKIASGYFYYALYRTASNWEWINTGVAIPSGQWSHIAFSKVLAGNQTEALKLYLNGQVVYSRSGSPYRASSATNVLTDVVNPISSWYYIGARAGDGTRFYGSIDEFKYWSSARSQTEIATDMHSNSTSDSNLKIYYDFNSDSLSNSSDVQNLAINGGGRTHLKASTSMTYEPIADQAASGPYTTVTFQRTYVTQNGGWKVPSQVNALSAIVLAGGGGGGAESDDTGWFGGGGGAGGYQLVTQTGLNRNLLSVEVGVGGRGGEQVSRGAITSTLPTDGQNSKFGSIISTGGGAGGVSYTSGRINGSSGGSGGGGATYSGSGGSGIAGQGNYGGNAASSCCAGGGGGGYSSVGGNGSAPSAGASVGGAAGNGLLNPLYVAGKSPQFLAGGGAGGSFTSAGSAGSLGGTAAWTNATANSGSGGGGGGSSPTNPDKPGGRGGSGIVIVRWITASVPSYTKPVNANLNVGMTETFTVNVAADSATAQLTRTFKWESSTAGASGPWTLLKQGTGAANAAFSWIPSDTSTSGSNYLYRLTVTDSDTAGLFITDSSTAYAVINLALGIAGNSSVGKTINSTKDETFTVTNGTPTYRYSLSPTISGITLDTRTAGFPVIRFAETVTVGTYLETLTVTDSVSASISLPITIKVSGPPTLSNGAEVVSTGQVLHIDSGNSASYTPGSSASGSTSVRDISGGKNTLTVSGTALAYSDDNGGVLTLSTANANYLSFSKPSTLNAWTLEGYVKLNASLGSSQACIITNQYTGTNMNYELCLDSTRTIFSGFIANSSWTYKRTNSNAVVPLNSWTHIVSTFDAATGVNIYLNGALLDSSAISQNVTTGGTTTTAGGASTYIGRSWDSNLYTPMSIGAVRIYNKALSATEVLQNYNATRVRFTADNLNQTKPSQKHNTTTVETFTVTSGGDTKTVTFAVGNRTGIEWTTPDTATVKLTVKPDLVVGTYYDTVTVTDNFSASTILPVKITVTKGDQAKISIGQYNAFPGRSTYPINATGGSGTGALTRTLTDSGTAQCVLTGGMFLTASKVGKCSVRVVKDTDANFLAETGTATIFWIEWNDAYATRVASTPTEIVLQHKTQIIIHDYETLTVTSYTDTATVPNTITSARPGQTIRILGLGFDSSDTSSQATFTDNEYADRTALTNDYIQVVVPTGAVTGPVIVDTLKGQAIGPTLTILSP